MSANWSFQAIEKALHDHAGARAPVFNEHSLDRVDLAALAGSTPPKRHWCLREYIPAGEVTLLTGNGGVGKSLLAQQLASALALGVPFLGLKCRKQRVMYLSAEDDADELARRQKCINERFLSEPVALHEGLFLASLRGYDDNSLIRFGNAETVGESDMLRRLSSACQQFLPDLVILDNLAHLFSGNENDRVQVTAFLNRLYLLGRDFSWPQKNTRAAFLLIGHPNKIGATYSGSTAWVNAVRSHLHLDYAKGAGRSRSPVRKLTVAKSNYANHDNSIEFLWSNGLFITAVEHDKKALETSGVVERERSEDRAFLRCLAAATARRKAVSENPGVNYFGKVFPTTPEGAGLDRAMFERAFERLLAAGRIELDAKLWQRPNRAWKFGIRLRE